MTIAYPPIAKRTEAIKDWACWATGVTAVWGDQPDGGLVRDSDAPWIELRPKRIMKVGTDEKIHEETGDATWPRREVTVAQRVLTFEMRGFSRSQDHWAAGWAALLDAHIKMENRAGKDKYFSPNCLSLNTVGDIINMPTERIFDSRIEDIAMFEFSMNTTLTDIDSRSIGSWIEQVEVTSEIKDAGGEDLLDSSIQLNDEVLP